MNHLTSGRLTTPLGPMIAIGDDQALYFLQFEDHHKINLTISALKAKTSAAIVSGSCASICSIEYELKAYFSGLLYEFKTPLFFWGTSFQNMTWQALSHIPYAQTKSYRELAGLVNKPHAHRAVANANARNHIVIAIPCHRIINTDGKLGGYSAGISRKQWLLHHEQSTIHTGNV